MPTPADALGSTPGCTTELTPGSMPGPASDLAPGSTSDPAPGSTSDPAPGSTSGSTPGSTSDPTPDLGDLMHVAFRRLRRGWSEQLAPFGLTPYQFRALQAVGRGPYGHDSVAHEEESNPEGLRLKDLAERLRIVPRSATEVVDQLQAKGLIKRRPDPADRRATRIVVTDDGARVREQIRDERRRQAGDYFSALSAEDRAELSRLLTVLVRSHP